jgi:hypothetical protein
MDMSMDESNWREFTDPHGRFRVDIPASWRVDQSESALTHSQQGRVWHGTRFIAKLHPPDGDENTRHMSVTIRIEQFNETPPPIFWDMPEPTDLGFLRTYRVIYDSDWLSGIVGHLRVHVQYGIQRVSRKYHPEGWQLPAPLSLGEQHRRRALVQRIINSFELLVSG